MKVVSATELKRNTAEILNEVIYGGKTIEVERYGKIVIEMIPKKNALSKIDLVALRKKYYGAIPDFPEVHKGRSRRRWKKVFD